LIEVFFLGTGGTLPTAARGLPSVVLRKEGELVMFDCGEGTQFRYLSAHLGVNKRMKIFITHLHGDHVLGLPGLLMTFSVLGRERELEVYGPKGIREFVERVLALTAFEPEYDVRVTELRPGDVVRGRGYSVRAGEADHTVPTLAYSLEEDPKPGKFNVERALELGVPRGPLWKRLQRGQPVRLPDGRVVRPEDVLGEPRPGLKVVYSGDTRPCTSVVELARGATLLIHDSTFPSELRDKALEAGHSTVEEACRVALEAGVGYLVLFHLSARITDSEAVLREARAIFDRVLVAEDLMKLELRDSGELRVAWLRGRAA